MATTTDDILAAYKPIETNFCYKPIHSNLQKVYESYVRELCLAHGILRSEFPLHMSINTKIFYPLGVINLLYDKLEWLAYSDIKCFETHCAWCYERRCESAADDNEHDECDLRMYYLSEQGITEQHKTLIEIKPELPTVIIDNIIHFLI